LAKEPTRKPKINGLELFMALASPLAVIGFIVFCIVFLDRFISAENIRERLRENGRAVTATILRDDGEDDYIWAVYVDQNGEERMGLIRGEDYPPRVMDGLTDGASLRVIYDTRFGGDGEVIVAVMSMNTAFTRVLWRPFLAAAGGVVDRLLQPRPVAV
jgi:hypothetical protein